MPVGSKGKIQQRLAGNTTKGELSSPVACMEGCGIVNPIVVGHDSELLVLL